MTKIIIVADDHAVVRSGIISILRHNILIKNTEILEAEHGEAVIGYSKLHKIDMLIMDINMPDTDAQMLVRTLLTRQPWIHIMVLSVNKEEIFGPLFLKLGAKVFVSKESGEEDLTKALRMFTEGKTYIRKGLNDFYAQSAAQENPYSEITPREMEILGHLVKGISTAQIAKVMNIGLSTASTHKASLFRKLRVSNVLELKELVDLYPI